MRFGEKVKIRAVTKNDIEALHKIYTEPDVLPVMDTRADLSQALLEAKYDAMFEKEDNRGEWLLIENEEGKVVGTISYRNKWKPREFYISDFAIGSAYRNKGYGTDALKVICKHIFEEKDARRIQPLAIREDFKAALRTFEKAGFTNEGVRRQSAFSGGKPLNEVFMSMLSREYFEQ